MERVHLHVVPMEIIDESLEIVLTLHHGNQVFPEEDCDTLEDNLEWWAAVLSDYAEYHESDAILPYDGSPDTKLVRRGDGGHTMSWSAFEDHQDGTSTRSWYSVDLDFEDFVRQVRDALVLLGSDPARNQLRFRGHGYERAIARLGAVLGENEPPPPLEDTLQPNYVPQPPGPAPLRLVVDWNTLAADPSTQSGLSMMLHVVFDDDDKHFPPRGVRHNATTLLSMATTVWTYWGRVHEGHLIVGNGSSLMLARDHDARQHVAVFRWWGRPEDVPAYAWWVYGEGLGAQPGEPVGTVIAHYELPNVDALAFTRQVIDAARTLLRLLDERGLITSDLRRVGRQVDDLERIVALVEANTPSSDT